MNLFRARARWSAIALCLLATAIRPAAGQTPTDNCASAPVVSAGTGSIAGSNVGATTDGTSTCGGGGDVWFRFDAPAEGTLLVDTCGSSLNTVVSLHTGCPGDSSNQVACSDNEALFGPCAGAGALTGFMCARVTATQSYWLRIAGSAGAQGSFQVRLTFAEGRGITVINHGFQLSDSVSTSAPNWLFTMAWAIQKRVPCSQVGYYEPVLQQFLEGSFSPSGAWQPSLNPLVLDPTRDTLLVFDWAVESGGLFKNDYRWEGWAEGAGDALTAALVRLTGSVDLLPQYRWHFIGHSRGAVVNSESIERLGGFGVTVDQMTMLDPHDFDQSGVPFDEDWKDWMLGQPQSADHTWPMSWGFTTWANVAYADNYFSTESTGLTPDGRRSGSLARELDVGAFTSATIDHSRVHAWYHGTADLLAPNDGDGLTISATWYPGAARGTEGWNASALGGALRPAPTNARQTYSPQWQPLDDGVFNGNFSLRSPFKPDPIAGWYLHGGNQAEDTIRTESGGNTYLELSTSNPAATHNLLAVPPEATHLRLRVLQEDVRDAQPPLLFVGGDEFGEWRPGRVVERGTAWADVEYEINPMDQGRAVTISVMLAPGATTTGIDDLRFVVNTPVCVCPGDADQSLSVEFADITAALGNWGAVYTALGGAGDADCSLIVDFQDITAILSRWGQVCPPE